MQGFNDKNRIYLIFLAGKPCYWHNCATVSSVGPSGRTEGTTNIRHMQIFLHFSSLFIVSPSISSGFYPPFPYRFLFLPIASYWLSTPRRYSAELPVTSDCVVPPLLFSIAPSERRLSPPPSLFIYNTHFFRIIYAQ